MPLSGQKHVVQDTNWSKRPNSIGLMTDTCYPYCELHRPWHTCVLPYCTLRLYLPPFCKMSEIVISPNIWKIFRYIYQLSISNIQNIHIEIYENARNPSITILWHIGFHFFDQMLKRRLERNIPEGEPFLIISCRYRKRYPNNFKCCTAKLLNHCKWTNAMNT